MQEYKTNKQVLAELDARVIGHQTAKKTLINAMRKQNMKFYLQYWTGEKEHEHIDCPNILLHGASGTGKTYLVQTLADALNMSIVIVDATELNLVGSSGGIKPKDLEKMIIEEAKAKCIEDPLRYISIESAVANTVVFVDEIDKLAKPLQASSNWNVQVQSSLLTMIDSYDVFSSCVFIFAGAFAGIEDSINNNKSTMLGFCAQEEEQKAQRVEDEHLIKYGLLPEFVGRLSYVVGLDVLTEDEYKTILNDKVLDKKNKELEALGLGQMEFEDTEETDIIQKAIKSKQGVRSMIRDVNKLALDFEFEAWDSVEFVNFETTIDEYLYPPEDTIEDNKAGEE